MKSITKALPLLILFAVLAVVAAPAQTIYAGGVSFAPGAEQRFAGTALLAKPVSDSSGTYAFTVLDAVPTSYQPMTVTTNIGAGIAQRVVGFDLAGHKVEIFVPTSAGVSWTGKNVGWQWNAGGLADIPIKGSWGVQPHIRFLKSSVNDNSGYQVILGVLFRYRGWGQ